MLFLHRLCLYEIDFLLPGKALQFPFALAHFGIRVMLLAIDQAYRSANFGIVRASLGVIVMMDASFQIVGRANIVCAVIAMKNIGVEHLKDVELQKQRSVI